MKKKIFSFNKTLKKANSGDVSAMLELSEFYETAAPCYLPVNSHFIDFGSAKDNKADEENNTACIIKNYIYFHHYDNSIADIYIQHQFQWLEKAASAGSFRALQKLAEFYSQHHTGYFFGLNISERLIKLKEITCRGKVAMHEDYRNRYNLSDLSNLYRDISAKKAAYYKKKEFDAILAETTQLSSGDKIQLAEIAEDIYRYSNEDKWKDKAVGLLKNCINDCPIAASRLYQLTGDKEWEKKAEIAERKRFNRDINIDTGLEWLKRLMKLPELDNINHYGLQEDKIQQKIEKAIQEKYLGGNLEATFMYTWVTLLNTDGANKKWKEKWQKKFYEIFIEAIEDCKKRGDWKKGKVFFGRLNRTYEFRPNEFHEKYGKLYIEFYTAAYSDLLNKSLTSGDICAAGYYSAGLYCLTKDEKFKAQAEKFFIHDIEKSIKDGYLYKASIICREFAAISNNREKALQLYREILDRYKTSGMSIAAVSLLQRIYNLTKDGRIKTEITEYSAKVIAEYKENEAAAKELSNDAAPYSKLDEIYDAIIEISLICYSLTKEKRWHELLRKYYKKLNKSIKSRAERSFTE